MTFEEIKAKFAERIEKDRGDSFQCVCPGHDDHRASLTVSRGGHGATLIHCHAGCDLARILSPVGLAPHDLFSNGSTPKRQADPVVARYDYQDAAGAVLFQVERRQSKKFAQRQPDKEKPGEWAYNLKGVDRVLYHLPELMTGDGWVLLCEGEKDTDNLRKHGYTATTNAGGAGKWLDGYTKALHGRRVCILPDNDEAGRKHALMVGAQLAAQAAAVRVLELPGLPQKGDVSDWLAAGNDPATLAKLVELAPTFDVWATGQQAQQPIVESIDPEPIHCTDLGNARRMVKQFGPDLHYVYVWGKWFIWDGSRWAEDETGGIERVAKRTVASIYVEAGQAIADDERKDLARWALASEGQAKISAMIALARSELGISVKHSDLDGNPMLLNCQNGTIDLRTGKLLPHDRTYLATKQIAIDYDPDAKCPLWQGFLKRIMADNPALIDFLQRAVGYSLTASVVEQCLFFLYGTGSNGKSTFTETVQTLLGDYGQRAPTEMIMLKQNTGAIPNDIARLPGARFVVTAEIEAGRRLAESLVKDLTGGDKMVARFMRQEYFEFTPTHKLWIYGNHKPVIKGSDNGIWRRINLIPFTVQIPDDEKDEQLKEKLKAELPGILAWAVRGCLDWQRTRLKPPDEVKAATAAYRAESDALSSFIDECCIEGVNCEVRFDALYTTYKNWCERNGERAERSKQFGNALTERGFMSERGPSGTRLRVGIGLSAVTIDDAASETEEPNRTRPGWVSMEI